MTMSAQRQIETWTQQEYWELEEISPIKHEFINGVPYAMAGGTFNHTKVGGNVFGSVDFRLRGKPCNVHTSEQKVKVEATNDTFYPDAVIFCPPARFEGKGNHTLLTPSVIFEVLSPATKDFDRTDKFRAYRQIETLTDYILIEPDRVFVDHFRRTPDGWLLRNYTRRDEELSFPDLEITLPLGEIYRDLDVPDSLALELLPQMRDDEE